MDDESRPTGTAVHEAGHAIAALALGCTLAYATIVPDAEEGRLGSSCNEDDEEDPHSTIIVLFAGHEAEQAFFPDGDLEAAKLGAGDDDAKAAELLKFCEPGVTEDSCRVDARRIVAEHWRSILLVALELDHWKLLVGDAIELLHDLASGATDDIAGIARWRAHDAIPNTSEAITAEYHRLCELVAVVDEAEGASRRAKPAPPSTEPHFPRGF